MTCLHARVACRIPARFHCKSVLFSLHSLGMTVACWRRLLAPLVLPTVNVAVWVIVGVLRGRLFCDVP